MRKNFGRYFLIGFLYRGHETTCLQAAQTLRTQKLVRTHYEVMQHHLASTLQTLSAFGALHAWCCNRLCGDHPVDAVLKTRLAVGIARRFRRLQYVLKVCNIAFIWSAPLCCALKVHHFSYAFQRYIILEIDESKIAFGCARQTMRL
jgi:hypothetical protein